MNEGSNVYMLLYRLYNRYSIDHGGSFCFPPCSEASLVGFDCGLAMLLNDFHIF